MQFVFNKTVCQNLRKSLRREWLETNGLGGYASSSLVCCNTRKYHGLLSVQQANPPGRFVLLSTLEESITVGDKEAFFSCRKHPDVYYPRGHEYLHEVSLGHVPTFVYRYGDVHFVRQIMMLHKQDVTLIRYSLLCGESSDACATLPGAALLRIKPLLAYRNMHALGAANIDFQVKTWPAQNGFSIRPYNTLPPLFMQTSSPLTFHPSPDWYHNVEYMVEAERGFANHEDVFQPGVIDVELNLGQSIIVSAATEDVLAKLGPLEDLWEAEIQRRQQSSEQQAPKQQSSSQQDLGQQSVLQKHLENKGAQFLVRQPSGYESIVAGYPWFEAWGRDTCIALSGLTFASSQTEHKELGWEILQHLAEQSDQGRIPNMFSADGNHAYNCIDASLWYVWAAQTAYAAEKAQGNGAKRFRKTCWPFIKTVIEKYAAGQVEHVHCDAQGFLYVGNENTQLTWMDAHVHGKAVTPRHGCPVEINALWYNALAFARQVAKAYGEKMPHALCHQKALDGMKKVFKERFWVEQKHIGYLGDTWRPEGLDTSLRPNQLFAVGLPHAILDEEFWGDVVETCRNTLLTPFGLRTLAPSDARYHSQYAGTPEQRDGAYHQGIVWPWLIGIYGDALMRVVWDSENGVRELLESITPLLTSHFTDAGVGSISEIFSADPPHLPDGCIAQAWSVAEVMRLLQALRLAAPQAVQKWEHEYIQENVPIYF